MCKQEIEEWAEEAALRDPCVGGCGATNLATTTILNQDVQYPEIEDAVEPKVPELHDELRHVER